MDNVQDSSLKVSKFKPKSRYIIHFRRQTFGKNMKLFIHPAMGKIVSLLFFYKDSFGIK